MKKPSLIVRFFSFLLKVLVVLVLMVVIAVASFEGVTYYLTGSLYDLRKVAEEKPGDVITGEKEEEETEIDDKNMRNNLFFVDSEDGMKQYIGLSMLNTETYAYDVILVPLNAQVTVGRDVLKEIQKKMPEAKNTVNLNDIARVFGEEKYTMISDILSNVLGIKMDGYDVMTEKNFVKLLNMADPVTYHLDHAISYRNSNGILEQLEGGDVLLDGNQAMAVMSYLDGTDGQESARLERTSVYLQSFISALLDENKSETIVKKYVNLAESSKDIDQSEEVKLLDKLDTEELAIRILQGAEANGVFSIDSQKAKLQIATLVKQTEGNSTTAKAKTDTDNTDKSNGSGSSESSKDYAIELYNAAYVAGLAGEWEAYLEEEGFNISLVDSYQDEGPISTTRIIVTEEGMGEDLLRYFPDAEIEVGKIDTGGDIQIYIGTDGTDVGSGTEEDVTDTDTDNNDTDYNDTDDDDTDTANKGSSSGSYSFDTDSR